MDNNSLLYLLKPNTTAQVVTATISTATANPDVDAAAERVKEMLVNGDLIATTAPKPVTDKDGNTRNEDRTFLTPRHYAEQGTQRAITDPDIIRRRSQEAGNIRGVSEETRILVDHESSPQLEFDPEARAMLVGLPGEVKKQLVADRVIGDSLVLTLRDQLSHGYDRWYTEFFYQLPIHRLHPGGRGVGNLKSGKDNRALITGVEKHVVGSTAAEYINHGYGCEYGLTLSIANEIRRAGAEFLTSWQDAGRWQITVKTAKQVIPIYMASVLMDRIANGEATGQMALDISDGSAMGARTMGNTYGCPVLQLLTNCTSHPDRQDWYNALLSATTMTFDDPAAQKLFMEREGALGTKFCGTRIMYGAATAGILLSMLLNKIWAKRKLDLFDAYGQIKPAMIDKLDSNVNSIANPDSADFFRKMGWQAAAMMARQVSAEYVEAAFRVSPTLRVGTQMLKDMQRACEAAGRYFEWVTRSGNHCIGYTAAPDMAEKSRRYRQKVNGKAVSFACKPFTNGFGVTALPPLFHQENGDVEDVFHCQRRAMEAGTVSQTVFDAACPMNLNFITDMVQWRRESLIDEASYNWNLFNWLVEYHGIEDRRKGHKPLCPKSAAQATYFVGHGGA